VSNTTLAEDIAFAAGSAGLLMLANAAVPVAGGIAVAASIPVLNHLRTKPRASDGLAVAPHVEEAVRYTCAVRHLRPTGDESQEALQALRAWDRWLPWNELCAGHKIQVPAGLAHPREVGFAWTKWASDIGQCGDWIRSMPDGARLHAHEFLDGRIVLHRDRLDPARGPATATMHWLSETPEGNALGVSLVLSALFLAWKLTE
jgi:hypothetical protein